MAESMTAGPTLGRRELLIGASVAVAGVAVSPPGRGAFHWLFGDPAVPFDRAEIATRIGETFRVTAGDAKGVVLTIAEIQPLDHTVDAMQQFLVRFSAPAVPALSQNTYRFSTRSFGDIPLFVSPAGGADGTAHYDAIVNRYVPGGGARP